MKRYLIILFFSIFTFSTQAQVKVDVEKKLNNEANQRANSNTDKAIDKAFDSVEEGIGNLFKKKNKKDKTTETQSQNQVEEKNVTKQASTKPETKAKPASETENQKQVRPNVQWAKFDFVPGDEVIFEDGPSLDEENGEFPSRWDLVKGQIEIAKVDGENVMMFIDGMPEIVPYLKNSKEDYLPEVFTIEFDFYRPAKGNRISVYLSDRKNQKNNASMYMDINYNSISEELSDVRGEHPDFDSKWNEKSRWIHVSIAFTNGKLKVYMDDTRLINIPHYEGNPSGLSLQAYWADLGEGKAFYFKNVRIAKGGVKYYDRVLSDGKIIVNGIRFDVNKATIKPESNGAINEIFSLMEKQPDLNFSVEGHTDSDGDDKLNQSLSEARAKAVMDYLIGMGIPANRLKSAGWGESKPIGGNDTPEGKANNRRVEFVKFEGNGTPASGSSSNGGSSAFDKLDRKAIAVQLEQLPEAFNIPISNQSGIVNGAGTVILYATSDGNLGKMQILDVDKKDNYKLTAKFITYNYNGSIHSQSNHLEIEGTYTCDLDDGKSKDVDDAKVDFQLGRADATTTTLYKTEESILRVYSK